MKQLTCEMCGSTDLLKENGVFVCQVCGCKYTVEEARKLMMDGPSDAPGSAPRAPVSSRLDNLYTLARRAKEEDNFPSAADYYRQITLEDPNSWEATFYSAFFTAMGGTIGQIPQSANTIANSLKTAAGLIRSQLPPQEQEEAYTDCISSALAAAELLTGAAYKTIQDSGVLVVKDLYYDPVARMYKYPETTSAERQAKRDFTARVGACDTLVLTAGEVAEFVFEDYKLAQIIYTRGTASCEKIMHTNNIGSDYLATANKLLTTFQNRLADLEPKLQAAQARKNAEYWLAHADEKAKYDARMAELDGEMAQLRAQVDQHNTQIAGLRKELQQRIPEEDRLAEVQREQRALIDQKNGLGLFAGKQKKALQEQIDAMEPTIQGLTETVRQRRSVIREEVSGKIRAVEKQCQEVSGKIAVLETEYDEIQTELTRDR